MVRLSGFLYSSDSSRAWLTNHDTCLVGLMEFFQLYKVKQIASPLNNPKQRS